MCHEARIFFDVNFRQLFLSIFFLFIYRRQGSYIIRTAVLVKLLAKLELSLCCTSVAVCPFLSHVFRSRATCIFLFFCADAAALRPRVLRSVSAALLKFPASFCARLQV